MLLSGLDWSIVVAFFAVSLLIGLIAMKHAGQNAESFFLSGRSMPWWLLGVSMVATTFSTDTPNLVTDIVRKNGISGNWQWWAFLLTGMLTVFVYAKLWRRSGVLTDLEFYELRYSGRPAAVLRGFRAVYLGVFFNIMIMATVNLAAIKIGSIMLGLSPVQSITIAAIVTVAYSMIGGLSGVILTDFFQFSIAMFGSLAAAIVALRHPQVGGLTNLLAHENVAPKLSFLPDFGDPATLVPLFLIPIAVQWWSTWYPGSEPGGGGYVAQRMLAAKSERHAVGATLLFNACHYALRPWPWIIVALCSLIVFPDLPSLKAAFPHVADDKLGHDLAYPAMLTFLPSGLLGLVVASLAAAYMSTISTHLNWGSSYIVNDVWCRFVRPEASGNEQVNVGRISTAVLMFLSCVVSLQLTNALKAFEILLQIGAGTGLLFILRWFWWRINAFSEITGMVVSFAMAILFWATAPGPGETALLEGWQQMLLGVAVTTVAWVVVTFITPPADEKTLRSFVRLARPGGPGWAAVVQRAEADGELLDRDPRPWDVPAGLLCGVLGCFAIYGTLFSTGFWLYGNRVPALIATGVAMAAGLALVPAAKRLRFG